MACRSCGMEGVDGICSMCYGDPWHNTDGEYLRWIEEQARQEHEQQQQEFLEQDKEQ